MKVGFQVQQFCIRHFPHTLRCLVGCVGVILQIVRVGSRTRTATNDALKKGELDGTHWCKTFQSLFPVIVSEKLKKQFKILCSKQRQGLGSSRILTKTPMYSRAAGDQFNTKYTSLKNITYDTFSFFVYWTLKSHFDKLMKLSNIK